MAVDLRKEFFKQIRDRREALDRSPKDLPTIEEVTPPERLWGYLDYVGSFLLEAGVITPADRELAIGLIQDYEDRMRSLYPGV